MWYVGPAKAQISLRIHAVWSEPLLVAWIFYDCYASDWFGVSKLKRRLHKLVWDFTCQNATLLEITCLCSFCFFWCLILFASIINGFTMVKPDIHVSRFENGENGVRRSGSILFSNSLVYIFVKVNPLFLVWFDFLYVTVNSYGHVEMVSSPNYTFSWASLTRQLTSTLCTYFCL